MATVSTRFASELKKLIDAEIERQRDIVCKGDAIKDFPTYQRHVGAMFAYKRVLEEYFDEAETKTSERL